MNSFARFLTISLMLAGLAHAQDGQSPQNSAAAKDKASTSAAQNSSSTNVVIQSSPQATAQAPVVVSQPTTYVEATPLEESRADRLRKARQDTEVQTEQKIVEKLEQSR